MSASYSIRLDAGLRRDLQKLARLEKRKPSDLAREALRRYIALKELRRLREEMRPHAQAAGYFTDEDVFKAVS
jgi:predicted transcriptional regulator